jgi:hypothetical protein
VKTFAPGTLVVLNEKTQPLLEHKGWLVPGRLAKIVEIAFESKKRRNRWYRVQLLGKSMNVIGLSKVPSNWLDLSTRLGEPADEPATEE